MAEIPHWGVGDLPTSDDSSAVSTAMRELLRLARPLARGDAALLILGEPGSGKEWLARRIHGDSLRADGPFVVVDCAALAAGSAHVAPPDGGAGSAHGVRFANGAGPANGVTPASGTRSANGALPTHRGEPEQVAHALGLIEGANGGTLFLDGVGALPAPVQLRVLALLQDHAVGVGGGEQAAPDVRVIASEERSLEDAVAEGVLRPELYERLAVVTLRVPPLRHRRADIAGLLEVHGTRCARGVGRPTPRFNAEAYDLLVSYSWPGNVRELFEVVEGAVFLDTRGPVGPKDLPDEIRAASRGSDDAPDRVNAGPIRRPSAVVDPTPFADARERVMEAFELDYLTELLVAVRGRVGDAAERADMSPRTLYNKMQKHGLRKEDFKR